MNKAQLISRIAKASDVPKPRAIAMLEAFGDAIAETLSKGEVVHIAGFGTFQRKEQDARTTKTRGGVSQPKVKITFAASTTLKSRVG